MVSSNTIPENTTQAEHIDLARKRAENLEEIARKRPLTVHERKIYDNARRVVDRNSPAAPGSRKTGDAKDLVMAGSDGPATQTQGAAADAPPPAAPAQPANAVGTTIEGRGAGNPDGPRASANDGYNKEGTPKSPPSTSPAGASQTTGTSTPASASPPGSTPLPSTISGNPGSNSGSAATSPSKTPLPNKPHVSGGRPELPEGAKLLQSSEHWFIFEHNGKKWVRFYAPEARSPNNAVKGGTGSQTDQTSALLNSEGRVYVDEGQTRLAGVVKDGTTNQNTVQGHPQWLEYEFHGNTDAIGHPPDYSEQKPFKFDSENPYTNLEGYD